MTDINSRLKAVEKLLIQIITADEADGRLTTDQMMQLGNAAYELSGIRADINFFQQPTQEG